MSLIALAEAIDRLVDNKHAYISESETIVTVSALSVESAQEVLVLCKPLGWPVTAFDRADELWADSDSLEYDFSPFRLVIQKPSAPEHTLQLLSNHAFAHYLRRGHHALRWHIARIVDSIVVGTGVIQSWDGKQQPGSMAATKSPRALVREFGSIRNAPEDIRFWLAPGIGVDQFSQPATQIWVHAASAALICCLPDEIDSDEGTLKFRGPPRLTLARFDATVESLDQSTFNVLLDATRWVFENEREAEMRHILLAAELARAGAPLVSTSTFLRQHLAHAWESAQIAYQMALAETGRDTLKVLSDLRKAVTEETAKLSDMGRQLTGAVAAALATGIGLIAARVAANAPAELVLIVMLIAALYTAMVITSGVQFMRLQRQLRAEWQHRLYRFLPTTEYERMVAAPTAKAERSFVWTAWLGGIAVVVLALVCTWLVLVPNSSGVPAQSAIQIAPVVGASNITGATAPSKPISPVVNPVPSLGESKSSSSPKSGK